MDFLEHELEEILNIFREESEEQIQKLNKNLLKLESNPKDYTVISELFREAHSLKGAARMIGLNDIQSIAHKLEDVLGLAKDNRLEITSEIVDTLCKTIDAIASIVNESIETMGKSESLEIEPVIKALEDIIEYDPPPSHPSPEPPPVRPVLNSRDEEEVKKLITQIKVNIEKLKIFSSSSDALEEFLYFIDGLKCKIDPFASQRVKCLIEDIKIKIETALKGSGVLTDGEVAEIEEIFEDFCTLYERVAFFAEGQQEEEYSHHGISEVPFGSKEDSSVLPQNEGISIEQVEYHEEDEDKISFIKNNIIIFSQHTDENIRKFDSVIFKLNLLVGEITNETVKEIIEKITEILTFSKEKDAPLNHDMVNVVEESYTAATQMLDPSKEVKEDPGLILQRITVLKQMLKLAVQNEVVKQPESEKNDEKSPAGTALPPIRRNADLMPKNQVEEFEKAAQLDPKFGETNTIKTLRVDTQKLDQLVNQVGELIIAKIKAKEHLSDTEKIIRSIEEWYREWSKTKQYFRHIERYHKASEKNLSISSITSLSKSMNSFIEENSTKLSSLMGKMNLLYKVIQEDDARLNLIVGGLEEKIKSVRVLPLATIFHLFPRMVRDISREKNKEIDFVITGSETSVDKKIIEEIKSPLMHIIRNAIDHGIEPEAERVKKGKLPTGRLLLAAYHLENSVLIEISDDGKGIDTEAIKKKVLQKGLLTPEELESMSEEQIMNIIFWPGFSTGETVTDISGRGIGLDIVYTKISQLNGKVKVKSSLGKGCQVSIQLPVTMATIKSFLVNVNDQTFAIPTSAIKTTHLISKDKILYKEGKKTIIVDDRTVPICSLAQTLELCESESKSDKVVVIIVQAEDTQIGFVVDKLLGDQEILHKNLSAPLVRVRNVAGITTLGSGDLCLILNVSDLVKSAYVNFGRAASKPALPLETDRNCGKKRVLVVDDSTTTRILQKNILTAAGYNVEIAVNGFDALSKMVSDEFDLVVSDVEMPEINGYELVERLRGSDRQKDIPIILVTSLASEHDKKRGMDAGANAYIVKSEFNQEELLTTIKRLTS